LDLCDANRARHLVKCEQPLRLGLSFRNVQGQVISTDSVALARHGHTAFFLNPSAKPEDQRGVLELSSNSGQLFALGIRALLEGASWR